MARSRDDKLKQVRALLDKADSTPFEGEADSYRKKADALMTMYAIETFELKDQHHDEYEEPELRRFDYGKVGVPIFDESLSDLFYIVAKANRCEFSFYGYGHSYIVGFPSDLDYVDLLFTGVRIHLSGSIQPHVDPTQSYIENLYVLKSAGLKWIRVYDELLPHYPDHFKGALVPGDKVMEAFNEHCVRNGTMEFDEFMARAYSASGWRQVGNDVYEKVMPRKIGVRFTGEYARHCEETGKDRNMSNPATYQKNFVPAYVARIRERFREMQEDRQTIIDREEKGLVLADRHGDVLEKLYESNPEKRPHPKDCDCDRCHASRCMDPKCKRPLCVEMRKPVKYRAQRNSSSKFDSKAWAAGQKAANSADLNGSRGKVGSGNRELEG